MLLAFLAAYLAIGLSFSFFDRKNLKQHVREVISVDYMWPWFLLALVLEIFLWPYILIRILF